MTKTIDIIRKLRSLPMTQAEISNLTGIPQPRICRWEAGSIPVGADDALKLQTLLSEKTSERPAQAHAKVEHVATETVAPAPINTADTGSLRVGTVRRHAERRAEEANRRAKEAAAERDRRAKGGPPFQSLETGVA